MSKPLPTVGYDQIAANMRSRALFRNKPLTADEAITEVEAEDGKTLTLQERREFLRGWRVGAVTFALQGLRSAIPYLKAEQLEALADDLTALAGKHGIALSVDDE